jgi:hypothetical protein
MVEMTSDRERLAEGYFNCTRRERAIFEAGIKLGSIYHQFVGVPVDMSNVEILERSMERGAMVQPFVEDVKVRIDRSSFRDKKDEYGYQSLTGNMLDVSLTITIGNDKVVAEMRYIKELHYPLMFVKEVTGTDEI